MGYTVSWEQLPFSDYSYNNVLILLPKVIKSQCKVKPWGIVIGPTDDSCSCVERYPTMMTFSKTNRDPYTKDFMKLLILMVEYGAAQNLRHDDTDMTIYLEALEEVHTVHQLGSYYMQKTYFSSLYKD